MNNIYYNPEKFGLKIFGELDLDIGYDFDKFVIWQSVNEHDQHPLFWGADSGCSCPIPFESQGVDDLSTGTPQACMRALQQWYADQSDYRKDQDAYVAFLERLITL